MDRILEKTVNLAEGCEVRAKTTKPQEVASTVHKGSYQSLVEVFGKLVQRIGGNEYAIVGLSVTICYNVLHTTPEKGLVSEY